MSPRRYGGGAGRGGGRVLGFHCACTHTPGNDPGMDTVIIPILVKRRVKHREVKYFAQRHTANSPDLNPGCLAPEPHS